MTVEAGSPQFQLGPATRLLWRSPDTVHLELGSRSVVVDGLPGAVLRGIATRGVAPSGELADPDGGSGGHDPVSRALDELAATGFLWARPQPPDEPAGRRSEPPPVDDRLVPSAPRLAGELTALATRHGERAAELIAARRHSIVTIHGNGRAGPHLAAVLAAAGVGRVHCVTTGAAALHHALPGGIRPQDEGYDLARSADAAILRAAPEADVDAPPPDETPHLTVLVVDHPLDETRRAALHADRAVHLVVSLGVDHGVVGPLVVPGLTSCLRCADLHRRDRDPAWSALAAQLTVGGRYGPASDVAVATTVVGVAATQILAFLDGEDPAVVEGTLELRLPDWRIRRRTRPIHLECGCCAEE